jgi:hypothetical protein
MSATAWSLVKAVPADILLQGAINTTTSEMTGWIAAIASNEGLSNFEPESNIEVSLACFGLEPLVKNESCQCLFGKNRAAHGALPGKVSLSAKGRKVGAREVEHESGAALLAAHLQPAELRIGD